MGAAGLTPQQRQQVVEIVDGMLSVFKDEIGAMLVVFKDEVRGLHKMGVQLGTALVRLEHLEAMREQAPSLSVEKITHLEGLLGTRLDGLEGRFDLVDGGLQGLGTRLDGLESRLEERFIRMEDRLNRVEGRLDLVESRLEVIDSLLQSLEKSYDNLDSRVHAVEGRMDRLEAGMSKLDARFEQLSHFVHQLAQQVKKLGDNIGFGLEDVARLVLPGFLSRNFSLHVSELTRNHLLVAGQPVEVDLHGVGDRDGIPVTVVGEVKSSLYAHDVTKFARLLRRASSRVGDHVFPVMFAYYVHPSAAEVAAREGITLVASYQR